MSARKLVTTAAWLTSLLALAYLLDSDGFAPLFRAKYLEHRALVTVHGVAGALALSLGPLLIFTPPTDRGRHRTMGAAYLAAVLVGGLSGAQLAGLAFGGLAASSGFATLALLWLASGVRAYTMARARDIPNHRRWMLRNYALTFSAVTLRGLLHVGEWAGVSLVESYPWAAWLCWTINLALVEVFLGRDDGGSGTRE